MQFCEHDCVAYTKLKEEGTCNETLEVVRDFASGIRNVHVTEGIKIFENFDCYNVSTYHFFESDDYAETCTGLLSTQSRGKFFITYRHHIHCPFLHPSLPPPSLPPLSSLRGYPQVSTHTSICTGFILSGLSIL